MKTHRMKAPALALLSAGIAAASLHALSPATAQQAGAQQVKSDLARMVQDQVSQMNEVEIHVVTDKPLYKPGETIWFRAFEVTRRDLAPAAGEHGITFALLAPGGAQVADKRALYRDGVATNDFALDKGIAGGTYVLRATSDSGASREVSITVSNYELPRVKKSLDFTRASYGPGDHVVAEVKLSRATGEPLSAQLTAVVTVDGKEAARMTRFSNKNGRAFVSFQLPASIGSPDARLSIQVDAGGVTESIERRIPLALGDVQLSFFPEGGELVAGLASRVYLAAQDPQGEPVEVEGSIFDDRGMFLGRFASAHEGMARFALTPEKGRSYVARLSKPRRAKVEARLPAAQDEGCVLRAADDPAAKKKDISLRVACTKAQSVIATAVLRGRLIGSTLINVPAGGQAGAELPIEAGAQGAVRVTLFNLAKVPLAERLVYRGRGGDLKVKITADKASYAPRDQVTLTVETRDASNRAVPADLALAVVDDTVLSLADDKETAEILARLYLLPEMPGQTIRKPNFYFSADAKAAEALDLLLGTKGYRRFEWRWTPQVAAP